jgi:hypothetical protein
VRFHRNQLLEIGVNIDFTRNTILTMSLKRSNAEIRSSPPVFTASIINSDDIDEDELEEDLDDGCLQLQKDLETFYVMKETVKKSSEGALGIKTISDYKRLDINSFFVTKLL